MIHGNSLKKFKNIIVMILIFSLFSCSQEKASEAFEYCVLHTKAQSYKVGFEQCSLAAMEGNIIAQYLVGAMYDVGVGVAKDKLKATHWYGEAAEKGHSDAQSALGTIYSNGAEGIAINYHLASKWLHAAADGRNIEALVELGMLYAEGKGVLRSEFKALELFERAGSLGSLLAKNNAAWLLATSNNDQIRDGSKALNIIGKVIQSKPNIPLVLDTQAAAYAELGRYDDAVAIQMKALSLLSKNVDALELNEYRARLQHYSQKKPWRDK